MRKIYKGLTADQKLEKIIFTSTLSLHKTESSGDITHKVLSTDDNIVSKVERLKDDSFFNNSPLHKYNIIRR